MSTNRENVTWKSPRDGLWYTGFFAFDYVNQDSPDFDHEWDVEYDKSRFEEVTRKGHATSEGSFTAACEHRSNPGGGWVTEVPGDGEMYDLMADRARAESPPAGQWQPWSGRRW